MAVCSLWWGRLIRCFLILLCRCCPCVCCCCCCCCAWRPCNRCPPLLLCYWEHKVCEAFRMLLPRLVLVCMHVEPAFVAFDSFFFFLRSMKVCPKAVFACHRLRGPCVHGGASTTVQGHQQQAETHQHARKRASITAGSFSAAQCWLGGMRLSVGGDDHRASARTSLRAGAGPSQQDSPPKGR